MPADHRDLASGQTPAAVHRFRAGLHVVQVVVALRFLEGHRQLQLRAGHGGQQAVLLRVVAELGEQPAGVHHRLQIGFQAEAAAQLGHHQHAVHAAAAETTEGFRNRHAGQAQFAQLRPEVGAVAQLGAAIALALFETVGITNQARRGVLQHLLLFAQFEVHGRLPLRVRDSLWKRCSSGFRWSRRRSTACA
ncbi:hypothetical protein D3C78_1312870 [compost metagenome]